MKHIKEEYNELINKKTNRNRHFKKKFKIQKRNLNTSNKEKRVNNIENKTQINQKKYFSQSSNFTNYKTSTLKNNFKILNYHTETINHLSILKDGRLVSCSDDKSFNIYNIKSYELQLSIKEHSNGILSFTQLNNGLIITCSKDKTMKVIKLINDDNYEIKQTLRGHNNSVMKVIEIRKNELISISREENMKIWILNKEKEFLCILNIIFQKSGWLCTCNILKLNKKEFVTLSLQDRKLKFWNSNNYSYITTIINIYTVWQVNNMCLINENLLCIGGSIYKGFYLIQISNHQIIKNIIGNKIIWSIYKCLDGLFLCSILNNYSDNSIVKYKYENLNMEIICIKDKAHDDEFINSCVELHNGTIASSGYDNLIKLWS